MKNLNSLSNEELRDFFNSFDQVVSDIDGVLWNILSKIPGTDDAVRSIRKLGKHMILVSNNTTKSLDSYHKELNSAGFNFEKSHIVTPILTMVSYLKQQNLTKKIFVLGMPPLKTALEEAGFKLAENGPDRVKDSFRDFIATSTADDGSVGAVISDVDVNLNYVNLQKAAVILEKPEVLFLQGATDLKFPAAPNRFMIGPGVFGKVLEDMTGRAGVRMAKPGQYFKEYIEAQFEIKDASRVLYVGDSVPVDMAFAAQSGYKKLLVLSGMTTEEAMKKWTFPEEYKPEYYVDSLKTVHEVISRIFSNSSS